MNQPQKPLNERLAIHYLYLSNILGEDKYGYWRSAAKKEFEKSTTNKNKTK